MDILISGSIAFDYLMQFPGRLKEVLLTDAMEKISLSLLVDNMTRHYGGVGANIAYTLGLLGSRPRLLGTAGKDFGDFRHWLEGVGVDLSTVVVEEDVFTGSFFANTDLDNNQIAFFYAGAMGLAGKYGIQDVTDKIPDLVVVSPNAPDAMQKVIDECKTLNIPYLYDPSQQTPRLDGEGLRHGILGCKILTVNKYEWELTKNKTGLTRPDVVAAGTTLIVTHGREGAKIYEGDNTYMIPPVEGVTVVDPTGGGDAFRAGILRGIELNLPWDIAGRMGSLAAAYNIEHIGTQNHRFTPPEFVERYRQHYDDNGALDVLLQS